MINTKTWMVRVIMPFLSLYSIINVHVESSVSGSVNVCVSGYFEHLYNNYIGGNCIQNALK